MRIAIIVLCMLLGRTALAEEAPKGPWNPLRSWQVELGGRAMRVTSKGYEPFARSELFGQASLGVSRSVVASAGSQFSLAPGLRWDVSGVTGNARGTPASLKVNRLLVSAEARYHPTRPLYGFVRVASGMQHHHVELGDKSWDVWPSLTRILFTADASVGATLVVNPNDRLVVWAFSADAGYSWAPSTRLALHPELPDGTPGRTGDVDLGSLRLGGPFARLSASILF